MDKAARLAEKNAAATQAAWARAGSQLAGIGASLAGAFAGVSLVDFVRSNIDALDALNDVADATGASIENISALEDVAKRTGTTMDTVSTALVKFNGVLEDAKPGSPAAQALRSIGLEAEKLKALDPAEALRVVAVALNGYADDGNKARLVQELFGKSVREVAPLLKDLGEQARLVATTTTEQAAAAEKFNKQLAELQTNISTVARAFVAELLPSLNRLLSELRVGTEVFGGFGAALIKVGTSNPLRNISDRVDEIAELRGSLQKLRDDAKDPPLLFNAQANEAAQTRIQAQIDKQLQQLEYLKRVQALAVPQADYSNEGRAPTVIPSVGGRGDKKKQAEQITEAQRALAAYVAELQRELEKTTEITQQQKTLDLLRSLGATGEVQQVRDLVQGLDRQITLRKQDIAIREDILRVSKEQEAVEKALADQIYQLSGRADEARKIALTSALEGQLNAGVQYSPEELDKIVKGIAGIADEAKEKFGELDELTKQFGRNVQDAFGDTVLATLRGDFDDILSLWGDLLLKMASQAIAADIGKSLFGNLFGSTGAGAGQLGGVVGELFSAYFGAFQLASGGVVDKGGITQFAVGDVFDRATRFSYAGGRIGELGEAGPEAIMPLRRGRDGKLGVAAGGNAGPNITIHIASGVSRAELASLVPQLTAHIKAEVLASARRPGA